MATQLPPTPEGWILGVDAGYRHHEGFVKDAGRLSWSLSPCEDGLWRLDLIEDRVALSSRKMTFEAAVGYAR